MDIKVKNIAILGSTGSIGTQALDIARNNKDRLNVRVLAANSNVNLIEKQIREFLPDVAVLYEKDASDTLKTKVRDLNVKVLSGMEGMIYAASYEGVDTVLTSVVGMIGLKPTISAINAGKDIALANKETLVCAGHIIIPLIKEKNVALLPVDSEHSAIFQSLDGQDKSGISKILLTASGGPFRGRKYDELKNMGVKDALKHPNWAMGQKITIDSATMVNKALEVMEAGWLFDVGVNRVEVIVHPQSIIHSMVEYVDGAVIAQLGVPDMRLPIQYALFYPERVKLNAGKLDFFEIGKLTFEKPDMETFKGLKLGIDAGLRGGSLPTVFNAANEEAVSYFLKEDIKFTQIYDIIEDAMSIHTVTDNPDVDTIISIEEETRRHIREKYLR